jgi:hypothetical protein
MKTPSLLEAAANCDARCEQRIKANYEARSERRRLKAEATLAEKSELVSEKSIEQQYSQPMPQVRREENTTERRNRESCILPSQTMDCPPECMPWLFAGSVVILVGWRCVHIYQKRRAAGGAQEPSTSNVRDTSGPPSGAVSKSDSVPPSSSMN